MNRPPYRICIYTDGPATRWQVIDRHHNIISQHTEKADAERAAQRYVAEDRDFAMEGR